MSTTFQANTWESDFGKEYTDRSILSTKQQDDEHVECYGITRTQINKDFLDGLDLRKSSFLEVGCNVGNQLIALQDDGYEALFGIELQQYAVDIARNRCKGINIIKGSALDIPFKDGFFDVVFTSGVLIHISPDNIGQVIDEIYRCSNNYIWGFEYFAEEYTEIDYRGNDNLMWKTDFAKLFIERHSDLELVNLKKYKYLQNENVDCMYLLKKKK